MSISTYQGSSQGANSTPTASDNGTSGNFPMGSPVSATASQIAGMSPADFFAEYKISSTDQALYLDKTGGLNANAADLVWYESLGQAERQTIQQGMVTAGYLSSSEATGINNSASLSAFQSLMGYTTSVWGPGQVSTYIDSVGGGIAGLQNQISANLTKAQENATQPIVATVENPTTLSADITAAFETALGYSPDQAQISSFINQVQGQDTAYAEAPRTEAQQQIDLAHSEESALNKLGPDGIDTVIQAYQAAVSGTKLPGAGTVQGPANGNITTGMPGQFPAAETVMQPGSGAYISGQGTEVGFNTLPQAKTRNQIVPAGGLTGLMGDITGSHPGVSSPVTSYSERRTGLAPALPAGQDTSKTYGGLYALSAADWKKAQADYAPAKKYATPGAAPQSVQLGAFSAVLQAAYDSSGSWSKAVASIASGSPFGTAEGTHLSTFGNQVAAEVNSQIQAVQNQVNNDTVTTKVSAPDATAEANLAAKQSDPTGYYASQAGSWGSVLNKMLSGTPSMYNQSSSDTFTGPVQAEAQTAAATAPTTVGAGAP